MLIEKIQKFDKIFNFNLVQLLFSGNVITIILLLQIVWFIVIVLLLFKSKKTLRTFLNLLFLQFSIIIFMFYHYIHLIKKMLFNFSLIRQLSYEEALYALNSWFVFFSYEIVIGVLSFALIMFIYFRGLRKNEASTRSDL